jgi:hypothetical protein
MKGMHHVILKHVEKEESKIPKHKELTTDFA